MSNSYPLHSFKSVYKAPSNTQWQECKASSWWRLFTQEANTFFYDNSPTIIRWWTRCDGKLVQSNKYKNPLIIEGFTRQQRTMIALHFRPN